METLPNALPVARILMFLGGALVILVLVQMVAPISCARAGRLARRNTCAANLRGMGRGLHTYANDGNQGMPIALHMPPAELGKGAVRYAPGMIGKHREVWPPTTQPTDETTTEMSTTRNLWTLIREGGMTPSSFVCPESGDEKNDEEDPEAFWDFRSYREVSYGYQVPYGKCGRPVVEGDARMVLAADKGPYSAALEAGKRHPGPPQPGLDGSPQAWRPWNSPNHKGEGQNVLYADTHVEWVNIPIVGPDYDNIYTRWSDPTGGLGTDPTPRMHGTPPTGIEAPFSDTDSLIYP